MNFLFKLLTRWSFNKRLKRINRMTPDEFSDHARDTVGSLVELAKNNPEEYDRRVERINKTLKEFCEQSR